MSARSPVCTTREGRVQAGRDAPKPGWDGRRHYVPGARRRHRSRENRGGWNGGSAWKKDHTRHYQRLVLPLVWRST
ncbi:unnamed protein product [Ectocarpus sp. CCAP 1310/34]|nr:unnamed protein product [Ectocarpus sp. CCAP 1310/34]